jgi:hypothetical protein
MTAAIGRWTDFYMETGATPVLRGAGHAYTVKFNCMVPTYRTFMTRPMTSTTMKLQRITHKAALMTPQIR